jgi:hypothetical protein
MGFCTTKNAKKKKIAPPFSSDHIARSSNFFAPLITLLQQSFIQLGLHFYSRARQVTWLWPERRAANSPRANTARCSSFGYSSSSSSCSQSSPDVFKLTRHNYNNRLSFVLFFMCASHLSVGSWRCSHALGWKSMTSSRHLITTILMLRLALIHSVFKMPRAHTINPVFSSRLPFISPLNLYTLQLFLQSSIVRSIDYDVILLIISNEGSCHDRDHILVFSILSYSK